ncbi:hypothetical protein SAMN05421636_11011 [Pricia antarctica]|uniref:Uncharacterized protein n=1 Tax=Pricia antarctica TaxID=641691 RepID=A0A1G7HQM6_9FLAO|nr:hypothetical protein SAMN05421636_11011 [Pricia antarctica]
MVLQKSEISISRSLNIPQKKITGKPIHSRMARDIIYVLVLF